MCSQSFSTQKPAQNSQKLIKTQNRMESNQASGFQKMGLVDLPDDELLKILDNCQIKTLFELCKTAFPEALTWA